MNNEDMQREKTQDELELIGPKNVARVLEGFVNALALQKQSCGGGD